MFYSLIRNLALILSLVLFRLQAVGKENIPSRGGFILASNHLSYLDPPLLAAACPRMLWVVAKEDLFKIPFLSGLIRALNAFPIKTHSADLRSLRRSIDELKAGRALLLFPEGGRVEPGKSESPLGGIGLIASRAAVPIVPAFVEGSERAWPVNSKFFRPQKIKVYFGRPFWPQEAGERANKSDYYNAVAWLTMQKIRQLKQVNF